MSPEVEVSFCVVNTEQRELLLRCLDAIAAERATLPYACEVLVLDNASRDGSAGAARRHPAVDHVLVTEERRGKGENDTALLRRAALETGVYFDNRVLDTILLSAMVWGQSAPHTLDALTARLGIAIPPEDRHTAMGDTRATAEAYLRLSAALKAKGLDRFEDVLSEVRRHRHLIEDANVPGPAHGNPPA